MFVYIVYMIYICSVQKEILTIKTNIMTITATKEFSKVFFTWNEELTECNHTALNVNDKDFDSLLNAKVHEGADLEGWNVEINF